MKNHTLDEVQDNLIGKIGTPNRNRFEYELQMDLIGQAIKKNKHLSKMRRLVVLQFTSRLAKRL